MKISVLGSGSTGNAVLFVANGTRVLVDAGLSSREIARRMTQVGEDPNSLDGILVTHEHGDHAGGLRVLIKDLDCPIFMSAKTRDAYVGERRNVSSEEPRRRADALRDRMVEIERSWEARGCVAIAETAATACMPVTGALCGQSGRCYGVLK